MPEVHPITCTPYNLYLLLVQDVDRLRRARWLLQNTDMDVTEVARRCGFQNGATLARTVRNALNLSPRQVRQAAHGDR
jgi:transcriptional regulator GlxA family with amidase domain